MEENQPPPKVSVLIPSWNNAPALRRCLEAIERSGNREAFEILVVDSGSQDESPSLDSEFPRVNMLRMPRHFGFVKALNIGMRTAVGDFIFFLPPETEVLPQTISALAARLEEASDCAAVAPLLVSPDGEVLTRSRRLPTPGEAYEAWARGDFDDWAPPPTVSESAPVDYLKHPALMVRANFLRGMRYIDERYGHFWWDLEVCCQIRRASRKILMVPGARAVLASEPELPADLPPSVRALFDADRVLGAARFAGKHYGFAAGFKLRLSASFRAVGSALRAFLTFREVGYHFSRCRNILSGQKLDHSQHVL